jgi:hypothetical protein
MKKRALSYDQAVEAYQTIFEATRALPQQPNNGISELRGTTWFLRNIDGPLARVNYIGEVRSRRIEE